MISSNLLFASDEAESYDSVNFPQWAKDLRRTEIITFGSLPFVTIWTTVIYSYKVYGEFQNPLDKSNSSFTEDDQWKIIKISAATCAALGLADLTINLILRAINKHKNLKKSETDGIEIIAPDNSGTDVPPPKNETTIEKDRKSELPEYFFDGVESAIF